MFKMSHDFPEHTRTMQSFSGAKGLNVVVRKETAKFQKVSERNFVGPTISPT
jgi:hypothetical protein